MKQFCSFLLFFFFLSFVSLFRVYLCAEHNLFVRLWKRASLNWIWMKVLLQIARFCIHITRQQCEIVCQNGSSHTQALLNRGKIWYYTLDANWLQRNRCTRFFFAARFSVQCLDVCYGSGYCCVEMCAFFLNKSQRNVTFAACENGEKCRQLKKCL